jgi:hypothetical protein
MGRVPARAAVPGASGITKCQPFVHQAVIGGVERHLVKPSPGPVEQHQFWRVALGIAPGCPQFFAAKLRPGGGQRRTATAFALHRFAQRPVPGPQILRRTGRGLVLDDMRGQDGTRVGSGHGGVLLHPA